MTVELKDYAVGRLLANRADAATKNRAGLVAGVAGLTPTGLLLTTAVIGRRKKEPEDTTKPPADDIDGKLDALVQTADAAVQTAEQLGREVRELTVRVKELEAQVEQAKAEAAKAAANGPIAMASPLQSAPQPALAAGKRNP